MERPLPQPPALELLRCRACSIPGTAVDAVNTANVPSTFGTLVGQMDAGVECKEMQDPARCLGSAADLCMHVPHMIPIPHI